MGEQSLAISRDPHEFFARHEFVARDGSWMGGDEIEAKLVTRTRAKDPNFAVRGLAECRQLLRDTSSALGECSVLTRRSARRIDVGHHQSASSVNEHPSRSRKEAPSALTFLKPSATLNG